jgi:hypothetical protein
MEPCATCGNRYDKSFQVIAGDDRYVFDCFECAIARLAPVCSRCACRIIGHGVEAEGAIFCGAHCAGEAGKRGVRDRA